MGYYPGCIDLLTRRPYRARKRRWEFDWGGRLLKVTEAPKGFPQNRWKSFAECKGTRELDCETYKSSRDERRAS